MKKITRFKNPHRRMQQSQVIHKGLPASGSVFFIVFIANPHTISNGQVGGGDSGAVWTDTDVIRTRGDSRKARSVCEAYKS